MAAHLVFTTFGDFIADFLLRRFAGVHVDVARPSAVQDIEAHDPFVEFLAAIWGYAASHFLQIVGDTIVNVHPLGFIFILSNDLLPCNSAEVKGRKRRVADRQEQSR